MPKAHKPRNGSTQFWPRSRAKKVLPRIRSWVSGNKAKPLGFVGYKAGMTHLMVVDNRAKSATKGEQISLPATIIECPPVSVVGASFYKTHSRGIRKISSVYSANLAKSMAKTIQIPKKQKTLDDIKEFDDLRLIISSVPTKETKKPRLIEIALGGSKDDKFAYAKEMLGKEVAISEVFDQGNSLDVHGITKGKGFQGTVKRYGVPIRQHKAEKTKRGIGNLGAWTPKRVHFTICQPGKMGYHMRTEYNKQLIKIGENGADVNQRGGITKYGEVKNTYLLLKGSVMGARKTAMVLTHSIRPNKKMTKEAPEVAYIHQ